MEQKQGVEQSPHTKHLKDLRKCPHYLHALKVISYLNFMAKIWAGYNYSHLQMRELRLRGQEYCSKLVDSSASSYLGLTLELKDGLLHTLSPLKENMAENS